MFKGKDFPVKKYFRQFLFQGMPSLDPANPLYCILIWPINTIYVSGKLGQWGAYLKIENGDQPILFIFYQK